MIMKFFQILKMTLEKLKLDKSLYKSEKLTTSYKIQ